MSDATKRRGITAMVKFYSKAFRTKSENFSLKLRLANLKVTDIEESLLVHPALAEALAEAAE